MWPFRRREKPLDPDIVRRLAEIRNAEAVAEATAREVARKAAGDAMSPPQSQMSVGDEVVPEDDTALLKQEKATFYEIMRGDDEVPRPKRSAG